MYSFSKTEEQQMLMETVHRYAENHLRPVHREVEENKMGAGKSAQTGWEIGLLPGSIDAEYGGFGDYSALTSAVYLEELGWGDVAISLYLLTPNLFALPVSFFGSVAQKANYLPRFCGEEMPRVTAALAEPVLQFDPAELATSAEKVNNDYVLKGRKIFVPLADNAEIFLIYAQEMGRTQAFIVPADTPGLTVGSRSMTMGVRGLPTFNLSLENVRVPVENRLGGPKGIRLNRLLTVSRIGLAALAVGQARAAYEYALTYAKERHAFGDPIAHRQSIAFMLANMAIEIESARLLAWEAAYKLDAGQDATRSAVMARNFAQKMVMQATDGAVQVLGGHGYIREYPVELWMRNGRGFAHWDGMILG